VVALLTNTGKMVEWVKHSAYGVPFALPAGDTDSDGDVDAADATHAHSITGSYQTLGRGVLSSAGVSNRRGYAGYEYDPTFEGAGGRHIYHVRHRVYDAGVGRWTRQEPLGYLDGMNLYAYVQGLAVVAADPWGLFICVGGCQPPTPGPVTNPGGGCGGSSGGGGAGGSSGSGPSWSQSFSSASLISAFNRVQCRRS